MLKSSMDFFDNSPNLIRFQSESPILINNLVNIFHRLTHLYLNGVIGTITFGVSLDTLNSCPNLVELTIGQRVFGDDVNPLCLKHFHRSELKGVKNRRIPGDHICHYLQSPNLRSLTQLGTVGLEIPLFILSPLVIAISRTSQYHMNVSFLHPIISCDVVNA